VPDIYVAFVAGTAANRRQTPDLKQKTASTPGTPQVGSAPARG
jgi:hypothetical protein